ncbi:hypothetical protein CYY_009124 [Polysphondylium violaceum]|uniref:non-specific serine/threonine protein kinase n=1 Tax=Polysphondylium violaceum TaxID=133409 RepID=A0A8J4PPE9_9MYCE|nr:hypothetical protein CYY_009124 [Polysphondylium violaceum]
MDDNKTHNNEIVDCSDNGSSNNNSNSIIDNNNNSSNDKSKNNNVVLLKKELSPFSVPFVPLISKSNSPNDQQQQHLVVNNKQSTSTTTVPTSTTSTTNTTPTTTSIAAIDETNTGSSNKVAVSSSKNNDDNKTRKSKKITKDTTSSSSSSSSSSTVAETPPQATAVKKERNSNKKKKDSVSDSVPTSTKPSSSSSSNNSSSTNNNNNKSNLNNNNSNSNKICKSDVQELLLNRFHSKNNVREVVVSALQSIFMIDSEVALENTLCLYSILKEENFYILDNLKNRIESQTYPSVYTLNSNSDSSIETVTSTFDQLKVSSLPFKKEKRERRAAEKTQASTIPIYNLISFIGDEDQGSDYDTSSGDDSSDEDDDINSNNSSSSSSSLKRPESLHEDDNYTFYFRVLDYNLILMTKIIVQGFLLENIIHDFLVIYNQIYTLRTIKSTTDSQSEQIEILNVIVSPIITYLSQIVYYLSSSVTTSTSTTTTTSTENEKVGILVKYQEQIYDIILNEFNINNTNNNNHSNTSNSNNNDRIDTMMASNLCLLLSILKSPSVVDHSDILFRKLLNLVYSKSDQHHHYLSQVFITMILKHHLSEEQIKKLLNVTLFKLSDTNTTIRQYYIDLLGKTISFLDLNYQKNLNHKVNDVSLPYKLMIMRSNTPLLINATHFKIIFDWILGGNTNTRDYTSITLYIRNIFISLDVISLFNSNNNKTSNNNSHNNRNNNSKVSALITESDELLWFWILWESSKYCIYNKLKTPYGNPLNTFEALEGGLLQLSRDRGSIKRIKILLQFMECLEKMIFSAANGSVLLPPPTAKEIQFFKHNARVSEDWFSRIRQNLLKASIMCSSAPDIARHATFRIQDIRVNRFTTDSTSAQLDLEFCILHYANALQQLNETESIQGLSQWSLGTFSGSKSVIQLLPSLFSATPSKIALKLPWMQGVIDRSKQMFENSVGTLASLPKNVDPNSLSFPFIMEQVIKSYLDISDFHHLDQFLAKYNTAIQASNSKLIYKGAYLQSLSIFNTEPHEALYQPLVQNFIASTLTSATEGLQTELSVKGLGFLGNIVNTDENIASLMIYQTLDGVPLATANAQQLIQASKENITKALNVLGMESNVSTFQFLSQLKIVDELEHGIQEDPKKSLPINNQIGFLERLRRVREHIVLTSNNNNNNVQLVNTLLTEKLVKLSRRAENYKYCQRLLETIPQSEYYVLEKCKLKYLTKKDQSEAVVDLIKYAYNFPQHISSQVQSKVFLEIIKYLDSSNNIKQDMGDIPDQYTDPYYYFEKATKAVPNDPKVWLSYADWVSSQFDNSTDKSIAVDAYFQFIRWSSSSLCIRAPLKILNILVNYGMTIPDTFERCFAQLESTKPFMTIIPQLFARLGHPDKFVMKQVTNLINSIGRENPQKIVYPTIVGSSSPQHPNHNQILLVKNELSKHSNELVVETEYFVNELGKITILWDDIWQYLLETVQSWMYTHTKIWTDEYEKVKASYSKKQVSSAMRKFNFDFFANILEKLKKLSSSTVMNLVNTPHEKWFVKTHFEFINKCIRSLEKETKPLAPFNPLQDLVHSFNVHRLNSLNLSSINPSLAQFRPVVAQMPGIDTNVTIQNIQPTVYLLQTKTKPKKISIVGSDGNLYPYLLKGREDLHLDERIMQLMNVIDQLLSTNKKPTLKLLRTRHYSVTPLSQSSGLIQWVEGSVPLFSLYKSWYRNEVVYKNTPSSSSNNSNLPPTNPSRVVVRPVDIFYSKLSSVLEKRGLLKINNRNEWPKEVLVQVFQELSNETPKWLLQRELWFSSSSSSELFLKTQSYSRSLALMSVIGYLIGLGDRHLDNILIDLKTAEIVHIDYNICFEKGLELRVPERVPFRMTQILEGALGLTGVHGTFRETSIQVMQLFKTHKDILLALLETFIYEPLFDWKHTTKQDDIVNNNNRQNSSSSSSSSSSFSSQTNTVDTKPDNMNQCAGGDDEDMNLVASDSDSSQSQDYKDDQDDEITVNNVEPKPIIYDDFKSIQGLTVVNQVKLKLEGTDQKLPVHHQIDQIIRDSLNIDNLSQMYEGWSPWI